MRPEYPITDLLLMHAMTTIIDNNIPSSASLLNHLLKKLLISLIAHKNCAIFTLMSFCPWIDINSKYLWLVEIVIP